MSFENWDDVKLNEITKLIKRGISPKYVEKDGHIIINQKCIKDNFINYHEVKYIDRTQKVSREKYLQDKDILVNSTGTGTLGRTAQYKKINENVFCDTHVTIVRADEQIVDNVFLAYYLSFQEPMIENYGKGATNQIELSGGDLGLLKIKLPPLLTQKKIAKVLSNYDDLIENNLKQIKLLEEKARLTYEEWFLRFRIDGQKLDIDENSGLPFGWKSNKLSEFLKFSQGVQVDVENQLTEIQDGYTRFIRIVDITQSTNDIRYIKTPTKNCIVSKKDIFMIRYGAPQVVIGYEGAIANNLFKISFTNNEYMKYYVFFFLKQQYLQEYLLAISVSSTMPAISFKSFGSIQINIPSKELVNTFNKIVEPIIENIFNLQNQNQLLKESRDILLPRLMTGMIDVEKLNVEV